MLYTIFFQCSVHVLALYVCTISIVCTMVHVMWYFSQTVGVTCALPGSVPWSLSYTDYYGGYKASSNEWLYSGNHLLHNKTATAFPRLPSLDDLRRRGSVGLLIDNTGGLHIFFKGTYSGKIATGLPINKILWGVASVEGDCSKIKSEMLSGKLDSVGVWVCECLYSLCLVHVLYDVWV